MRKLIIQQNDVSYTGIFSDPAFAFLGQGAKLIEGLYQLFKDYGITLNNISLDSSPDLSSPVMKVDLNELGDYEFGFEKIEWTMSNIEDDSLTCIPVVLNRGEEWLRSAIPGFTFQGHVFNYYNHSLLSEGDSQDFLREFSKVDIPEVGVSLGNGLILHWELPEQGWQMNLTIDHSNIFPGGLFIDQDVIVRSDHVDYEKLIATSQELFKNTLGRIGLELNNEA